MQPTFAKCQRELWFGGLMIPRSFTSSLVGTKRRCCFSTSTGRSALKPRLETAKVGYPIAYAFRIPSHLVDT